jgi:hypothetical protein
MIDNIVLIKNIRPFQNQRRTKIHFMIGFGDQGKINRESYFCIRNIQSET